MRHKSRQKQSVAGTGVVGNPDYLESEGDGLSSNYQQLHLQERIHFIDSILDKERQRDSQRGCADPAE
jgi:hypothetical protein